MPRKPTPRKRPRTPKRPTANDAVLRFLDERLGRFPPHGTRRRRARRAK